MPDSIINMLPVNMRQYVYTLAGGKEGLSEKDFAESDLNAMRGAVRGRVDKTGKTEGVIGYGDYNEGGHGVPVASSGSLLDIVKQSFQDPAFRLETTLGMAKYKVNDKGEMEVSDSYDFAASRDEIKKEVAKNGVIPTVLGGFQYDGWWGAMNVLGNMARSEGEGKPYTLNLGPLKQGDDALLSAAKKQFPILESLGMKYKNNPKGGKGFMEFWPPLEEGTDSSPRPKEFRLDEFGVEVYDPKTRPIDIMADVASHHLMQTDPTIKKHYEVFKDSMTKEQRIKLSEQYDHARKHEGEKRPFAQWADKTGIPGWFRGYAFEQWDHPEEIYTPDQMKRFDNMMDYLRKPR